MKIAPILICLLSTIIALGQTKIEFSRDSVFTGIFSEKEIEGIQAMVLFVDEMVLENGNTDDINTAYHNYFDEIAKRQYYKVPFNEEVKYAFLKSLDSAQFSTIWRFYSNSSTVIKINDTIYRDLDSLTTLEIRPVSKFTIYLKETGKSDPYYMNLYNGFSDVGNLTQVSYEWFLNNHKNFDFTIPKNRLWAMVFILRMEETFEQKLMRRGEINNVREEH